MNEVQQVIENQINNVLSKDEYAIFDGLINELYFKEKIKISWMLKEGYSEDENNLSYIEFFNDANIYDDFFRNVAVNTWHPIIYISYSILNNYLTWSELDYIIDKPEMCEVIKKIIIINANKSFSKTGTYTTFKNLEEGFDKYMTINLNQIEIYRPNVLIFGNTFHLYQELLGLEEKHKVQSYSADAPINVFIKNKTIYIDAYHPARPMAREKYINPIINAVKKFESKL